MLFAASGRILWWLGSILNVGESPRKADILVVVGGDNGGTRILTAAELVRQGYAPHVLVSGVGDVYGVHESDLAIAYAVRNGYPRDIFIPVYHPALSTSDEVRFDVAELRRLGVRSYLVVTSPWHTARAMRVLRNQAPELEGHAIAAPDRYWVNGVWWTNREGRKAWFYEMIKTVAYDLGI